MGELVGCCFCPPSAQTEPFCIQAALHFTARTFPLHTECGTSSPGGSKVHFGLHCTDLSIRIKGEFFKQVDGIDLTSIFFSGYCTPLHFIQGVAKSVWFKLHCSAVRGSRVKSSAADLNDFLKQVVVSNFTSNF